MRLVKKCYCSNCCCELTDGYTYYSRGNETLCEPCMESYIEDMSMDEIAFLLGFVKGLVEDD